MPSRHSVGLIWDATRIRSHEHLDVYSESYEKTTCWHIPPKQVHRITLAGWDASSGQAAQDLMRYVDQPAPKHHDDERAGRTRASVPSCAAFVLQCKHSIHEHRHNRARGLEGAPAGRRLNMAYNDAVLFAHRHFEHHGGMRH